MTVEQLRALHQGQPFRPFRIHIADGRTLEAPHPDFLSRSPTGRTIIVYRPDDSFSIVDMLMVTELEVLPAPSPAGNQSP